MDKSDYRKLFKEIQKSNDKVALDPILKKHGISTGNFYYFLAHEGEGDRAMSVKNLELIYNDLKEQGAKATNRSRLEAMDTKTFVNTLFKEFNLSKANIKPRDMTKWMNSFAGAEFKKKTDKK